MNIEREREKERIEREIREKDIRIDRRNLYRKRNTDRAKTTSMKQAYKIKP